MIHFASRLVISDKLEKKAERIKHKIEQRKLLPNVYLITFSSNEENLFDIMSEKELLFPIYEKVDLCVVGIAKGQEEVVRMVKNMIDQVYQETDGFDVRAFYQ